VCKNCLLKKVIEGNIEEAGRRRRRRKQILNYLRETRGFCELKAAALDRSLWRPCSERGPFLFANSYLMLLRRGTWCMVQTAPKCRFGGVYGLVARKTVELMSE
jgi:hypothetical protein